MTRQNTRILKPVSIPPFGAKLLSAQDTVRQRDPRIVGNHVGGYRRFGRRTLASTLCGSLFRSARSQRLRQLPHTARSPIDERSNGTIPDLSGQHKIHVATDTLPDENYARELIQLFSIGLVQWNPDGTSKPVNGVAQNNYSLDDITGLSGVFTGWDFDVTGSEMWTFALLRRPLVKIASRKKPRKLISGPTLFTTVRAAGNETIFMRQFSLGLASASKF